MNEVTRRRGKTGEFAHIDIGNGRAVALRILKGVQVMRLMADGRAIGSVVRYDVKKVIEREFVSGCGRVMIVKQWPGTYIWLDSTEEVWAIIEMQYWSKLVDEATRIVDGRKAIT